MVGDYTLRNETVAKAGACYLSVQFLECSGTDQCQVFLLCLLYEPTLVFLYFQSSLSSLDACLNSSTGVASLMPPAAPGKQQHQ